MKKVLITIMVSLMMSSTLVADYVLDISKYPVFFSNNRNECVHIARFDLDDLNDLMEFFEHSSTQMIEQDKYYAEVGSYYAGRYEKFYFFANEEVCDDYSEFLTIMNDSAKYR